MRILISTKAEWPCSSAWRWAVGKLMARSPAIRSLPPGEADAGNDSTSVGRSMPRNLRFRRRISASVVSSTLTCPRRDTACCAAARNRARVRPEGGRTAESFRGWATAGRRAEAGPSAEMETKPGSRRIIVRGATRLSGRPRLYLILRDQLNHWGFAACIFCPCCSRPSSIRIGSPSVSGRSCCCGLADS